LSVGDMPETYSTSCEGPRRGGVSDAAPRDRVRRGDALTQVLERPRLVVDERPHFWKAAQLSAAHLRGSRGGGGGGEETNPPANPPTAAAAAAAAAAAIALAVSVCRAPRAHARALSRTCSLARANLLSATSATESSAQQLRHSLASSAVAR
jgi:hypothetical protein